MVVFPSEYTENELCQRWDDFTSPARFAGNDEMMDLIFVSERDGNKVKLVRKAKSAKEPFSCVFQGKIKKTEQGSEIIGYFRKSFFDYLAVALIFGILWYMRSMILERGESLTTINGLLLVALLGGAFLLYNTRLSKRKYAEFIFRITECEVPMFLSKKEQKEQEKGSQE